MIRVSGLGKKYRIRHEAAARYTALRDVLSGLFQGKANGGVRASAGFEEFWALRDVSFEVAEGEVVGIIGRNGAGKSTLLKILSQITDPTAGEVELHGRTASLLEVGTGFHPELTGRENISLNGAILGMTRREIAKRFDEIVAFADVERFLDTPVKHYSSGMYVRLAFAVAAHLEPEILIVDEVLAVGDAEFQKKCLGKMRDVSRGGRTVLFVSHNMGALAALCDRGIVLERGRVSFTGAIDDALTQYSRSTGLEPIVPASTDMPCVTAVEFDNAAAMRGELRLRLSFTSPWPLAPPLLGVVVSSASGSPVFGFNTMMDARFEPPAVDKGTIALTIEDAPLHTGLYKLSLWFGEKSQNYVTLADAVIFHFVAPVAVPAGVSLDVIGSTRVTGRFTLT
jgi:lipopolysaccharide transport system ATP-binding protein